jgi:hypothetical protein
LRIIDENWLRRKSGPVRYADGRAIMGIPERGDDRNEILLYDFMKLE